MFQLQEVTPAPPQNISIPDSAIHPSDTNQSVGDTPLTPTPTPTPTSTSTVLPTDPATPNVIQDENARLDNTAQKANINDTTSDPEVKSSDKRPHDDVCINICLESSLMFILLGL